MRPAWRLCCTGLFAVPDLLSPKGGICVSRGREPAVAGQEIREPRSGGTPVVAPRSVYRLKIDMMMINRNSKASPPKSTLAKMVGSQRMEGSGQGTCNWLNTGRRA